MTYNTKRRRTFTQAQRAAFFAAHRGLCYLCGGKITAPQEAWDIEHIIAREIMGDGADADSNLALAHRKCHAAKTREDRRDIAKSNRVRQQHLGARNPSQMKSRGFAKRSPQRRASRPINKFSPIDGVYE